MLKRVSEKPFFLHRFRRADGRGWLNEDETIATASATVADAATGENLTSAMISNVAPYNDIYVRYKLSGGTKGLTVRITFLITTSNGQEFEDDIEVRII
jgi:hypothetical protein